jgi:hypothetical protein
MNAIHPVSHPFIPPFPVVASRIARGICLCCPAPCIPAVVPREKERPVHHAVTHPHVLRETRGFKTVFIKNLADNQDKISGTAWKNI